MIIFLLFSKTLRLLLKYVKNSLRVKSSFRNMYNLAKFDWGLQEAIKMGFKKNKNCHSRFVTRIFFFLFRPSLTDFHSCHGQYCIPLGQEQRKDYKLYLHWGRVHPEAARSPKIIDQ